jgi:hypothetical protein
MQHARGCWRLVLTRNLACLRAVASYDMQGATRILTSFAFPWFLPLYFISLCTYKCMYKYLNIVNSTNFSYHKIFQNWNNHWKYLLYFIMTSFPRTITCANNIHIYWQHSILMDDVTIAQWGNVFILPHSFLNSSNLHSVQQRFYKAKRFFTSIAFIHHQSGINISSNPIVHIVTHSNTVFVFVNNQDIVLFTHFDFCRSRRVSMPGNPPKIARFFLLIM